MFGYLGFFKNYRAAPRGAWRNARGRACSPGPFDGRAGPALLKVGPLGEPSLPFGTRGDVECTIGAAAPFEKSGKGCLAAGIPFFTAACQAGVAKRIGWSRTCSGNGASRLRFGTARRAVPTLGVRLFTRIKLCSRCLWHSAPLCLHCG